MARVSIGVDPSANATGVVILDAEGAILFERTLTMRATGLARLVALRGQLREICEEHGPFDIGVRESYSLGSTNRPFLLGEVGGIVQLALHDSCRRVEECAPKALKKFASSNASASKGEMIAAVRDRWGVLYEDDNLADAYALARLGLSLLDERRVTRRDQLEVMRVIQAPKKRKINPFRPTSGVV